MKSSMKFAILVVLLVQTVVFDNGCQRNPVDNDQDSLVQTTTDGTVNLNFAQPMTMSEVGQFTKQHGLNVVEVRLQRPGCIIGFRLDGADPAQSAELFTQEHRKFLELIASGNEPELAKQRASAIEELSSLNKTPLRVSSMTIEGQSTQVRDLPNVTITEHPLSPDGSGPPVEPGSIKSPITPNSVNHPSLMWAPYGGTSEVNKSYSYQRFIFNDVSKFGSAWSSYEHETLITDKNFANQSGYWASNMPSAYLDCGNGGDSVDNFAVGSFTASLFRTYTWYFAYIGLVGQSSPSSVVKIWSERGTTVSWSCWAVIKSEHAGPLVAHYTGGGISWQF